MKQKSKIKTILDAFTGKVDVTPEQWKFRLEQCDGCEFNSLNIDKKDLSITEVARKTLFPNKPFCTGCGCNIDEKTSQATEECAAGKLNAPLRWNRLKVETTDQTSFNIYNQSSKLVNIGISEDGKFYEIDYGTVPRNFKEEVKFQIFVPEGDELDIESFKPSCGACTDSSYKKVSGTHYNCSVTLNISKAGKGDTFSKRVWVKYGINEKNKRYYKRVKIQLIGKIVK